MKNTRISLFVACLVAVGAAPPAEAQLILGAPGSVGGFFGGHAPPDPNRNTQRLSIAVDLSGGQDRFPVESQTPDVTTPVTLRNNATTATVGGNYWAGRVGRSLEASAGGFVNRETYGPGQLHGANASLRGSVGRRTGLSGFAAAAYQPLALQAALTVASPIVEVPADGTTPAGSGLSTAGPPNGLDAQDWLSTQGGVNVFRNWNPRQRFDGGFTVSQWRPLEGTGLESRSMRLTAMQANNLTARTALRLLYRFEHNTQSGIVSLDSRSRLHAPEVGLRITRRLSPLRVLTVDVQGGLSHVTFIPTLGAAATTAQPIGSASLQYNLTRRWTVSMNASRDFVILNAFSNQPFRADQAGVQLAGMLVRRLGLYLSTAYVNGSGAVDDTGAFSGLAHSARLQYGLATWCGVFANYSYYQQDLTQLATPISGQLTDFNRHAARVGVTLWLPMYGTF